ncbi:MAG: Ig-like domain-containing protein [Leptospirales bacterium]|nr:Ig-like domain-containing protein [Leptospirales bacterium]
MSSARRVLLALSLLLVLAALRCSNDSVESLLLGLSPDELQPAVVATEPADGAFGFDGAAGLWALFNQSMDQEKTQSSFRLSGASGAVAGSFRWEGPRLTFTPDTPLSGVEQFTMLIQRSAESSRGVDLSDDVIIRFYASADLAAPEWIDSSPAAGAVAVPPGSVLRLRFSRVMDLATASDGISVSPDFLRSTQSADGGATIELVPNSPLANGVYTLRLNQQLRDISGHTLRREASIQFTVGADFQQPGIASAAIGALALVSGLSLSGAERLDSLTLQFSEAMQAASVEGSIRLSPARAMVFGWNGAGDTLTIQFSGGLDPETEYSLSIDGQAHDLEGNALAQAAEYRFVTNGVASLRPQVLRVRQIQSSAPLACTAGSSAAGFSPDLVDFNVVDIGQWIETLPAAAPAHCALQLQVDFNQPMSPATVMAALSLTPVLNPAGASPEIYDVSVLGASAVISLVGGFPAPGPGEIPIYRLRLRGGVNGAQNLSGAWMEQDYSLYLSY